MKKLIVALLLAMFVMAIAFGCKQEEAPPPLDPKYTEPYFVFYTDDGFRDSDFDTVSFLTPRLAFPFNGQRHTPKVRVEQLGVVLHKGTEDEYYQENGSGNHFMIYYKTEDGIVFYTPPQSPGMYGIYVNYFYGEDFLTSIADSKTFWIV